MSKSNPQCFLSQKKEIQRFYYVDYYSATSVSEIAASAVSTSLLSKLVKILVKSATRKLLFSITSSASAPVLPLPWSICPLLPP